MLNGYWGYREIVGTNPSKSAVTVILLTKKGEGKDRERAAVWRWPPAFGGQGKTAIRDWEAANFAF
jgi:hypothetical protein